jgi:hypothetical protein
MNKYISLPFIKKSIQLDRREVLIKLMTNIITDLSDDEDKLNDMYSLMINRVCELEQKEQERIDETMTPIERLTERFEKILRTDKYEDQEDFINQWTIYINNSLSGFIYIPIIMMIILFFIGYIPLK